MGWKKKVNPEAEEGMEGRDLVEGKRRKEDRGFGSSTVWRGEKREDKERAL